ncbi:MULTISPECIES: hypothetical protein [Cohnella]|uniref:hypothetical protein n=1 Tax=Cohnella TaxID=329857 RepID=UPI000E244B7F|nr:hypothetical protein [Cohnella phaseoli]
MVKKISILFICCFFFYSCGHKAAHNTEEASDFHFMVGVNKRVLQEGEEAIFQGSLEYRGKREIQFDLVPSMWIVVTKQGDAPTAKYKTFEFDPANESMNPGDVYSNEVKELHLEKGKYSVSANLSIFSARNSQYALNAGPIDFEVK